MTEKRYERIYGDIEVVAIDNWKIGLDKYFDDEDYDKFVDELNRLNDENEELKKELDSYKPVIFESESEKGYVTLYEKKNGDKDD